GIDEYDLCLTECLRCLKPGGYLEFSVLDSEIIHPGPLGSAKSVEFGFNLKTRGYDPAPTKSWLSRLRRAGYMDIKRAWLYLPMGAPSAKLPSHRETPSPVVADLSSSPAEAVHGPVGSTADAANISGMVGSWVWEQWLLKLQMEMGKDEEHLLEGVGAVFEEGRNVGAGWRCLNGKTSILPEDAVLQVILSPTPISDTANLHEQPSSFFKTLVDHEVTVELKNDISIRGTLKSVDQFLNIKLDDIQVVEELKYPHLVSETRDKQQRIGVCGSSVKNVFIRGSVVRYVHLPGAAVDTALLEDATRREAAQQASKAR
ncbi:MAG: hypothetical protein M1830_010696, partial [Pleopsidium flavum]